MTDNDQQEPSHPSLDLALEEARNRYENEESRRDSVENKVGILIAINTIIISLSSSNTVIPIIPALVSAIIALLIVLPRSYANPLKKDNFYGYAQLEPDNARDRFLLGYGKTIRFNRSVNSLKMEILKICVIFTSASLLLILLDELADLDRYVPLLVFIYPSLSTLADLFASFLYTLYLFFVQ